MPAAGFESALAAGDSYEEAEPAFASLATAAPVPPAGEEDGPSLEELETQMRGELAARDESGAAASSAARRRAPASSVEEEEGDGKNTPLPEVDALVARLPAEVRETLDELFRARFVAVKKLPKKLLQPATSKKGGNS